VDFSVEQSKHGKSEWVGITFCSRDFFHVEEWTHFFAKNIMLSKALRYKVFSVNKLSKRLRKLTKRLIMIIVVSFNNNKGFDYNENRRNISKIGGNNEFL